MKKKETTIKKQLDTPREVEQRYQHLIDNLKNEYFFYTHDTAGVFTHVSPSVSDMLGYSQEEFCSHCMKYLTDNPMNKEVVKYTKLSIQGIKQPPYEVEIFHKDGSVYTLEVSEYPVFDQENRVCFVDGIAHDITKRIQAEKEREKLILKLQEAFDNIKTLSGLLPICSNCKKIRDDKGYWNQIESYIRDHSEAEFSHGICPECAKKYYPDYIDDDN